MEDVLEVSTRPYAPQRPVVCLDEARKQLVAETRVPIPAAPGKLARSDDEYERQGTANLFMVFEPWAGQRRVTITERRPAIDCAHVIRALVEAYSPQADPSVLVMDNLNTHKPAALYAAFEPAEARRLLARLEMHHTPQHGSWFNMAETELSVLATQCLDRRIPAKEPLTREVAAWERQRNTAECRSDWQFTTQDARIKLKRLYPSIELG
jgi:DDE superfamily endonuclease